MDPQVNVQNAQQPPQSAEEKPVQKPKKENPFKKLVSVAILIFMVGWVFAAYYGLKSDDNQDDTLIKVENYDFYVLPDNTFATYLNIGGKKVPIAFRLDPRNASSISLDTSAVKQVSTAQKLYITSDPSNDEKAKIAVAAAEIARITGLYNLETVGAYTKDSDPPNTNVPIRTCDDVNQQITVIELGISDFTGIKNEKGCVKVSGANADELILAADKLGMNLIGIKL